MDVRLSPEQQALRDSVARVVGHLGPRAVGQLGDQERISKLDAAIAAAGWRELRTADDGGAPWASGVEAAIVADGLGRGLADVSYLGPTLAADLRRRAGAENATRSETVVFDPALMGAAVVVDGVVPPGSVAFDASGAETGLVLVRRGDGAALATVALGPADRLTDLTRPGALPAADLEVIPVGGRTLGADDLARWSALGLALTCADLVGVMGGAVDLAVEYAGGRQQYDRPIGAFQAVQHLLADAFVLTEGSRSVALHAAWAADALATGEAVAAGALAKAYCSRAARAVGETSIQVHGGIGNTWECLAHVHLRRALVSIDLFGGVGPNLERVLEHQQIGAGHGLR